MAENNAVEITNMTVLVIVAVVVMIIIVIVMVKAQVAENVN